MNWQKIGEEEKDSEEGIHRKEKRCNVNNKRKCSEMYRRGEKRKKDCQQMNSEEVDTEEMKKIESSQIFLLELS